MKKINIVLMVSLLAVGMSVQNSFACMVGTLPVEGKVVSYNKARVGVQIMQPDVVQQTGATCGYHAVLNAKILHDMLFKGTENQFLDEQIRNATFGDAHAPWKTFAIAHDNKYEGGVWLEAEAVEKLVQQYFPEVGSNFVILSENQVFFDAKHAECGVSTENRGIFWAKIKSQLQPGFFFAFFLNNQIASLSNTGRATGHWIVLCLYVDTTGRHIYYVMDSLNKYKCDEQAVMNVIDSIETDHIFIPQDTGEMPIVHTTVFFEQDDQEPSLLAQKITDAFSRFKNYIITSLRSETKKDDTNAPILPTDSDKEGGRSGLGILQKLKKTAPVSCPVAQNDRAIAQALQKDEDEEDPELIAAYKNSLVSLSDAGQEDDADLPAALQLSLTKAQTVEDADFVVVDLHEGQQSLDSTVQSNQAKGVTQAPAEDTSFMSRLTKAFNNSYNQFE